MFTVGRVTSGLWMLGGRSGMIADEIADVFNSVPGLPRGDVRRAPLGGGRRRAGVPVVCEYVQFHQLITPPFVGALP